MTLTELATYLGIVGFAAFLVAQFDLVIPRSLRRKVARFLKSGTEFATQPLSLRSYFFVVVSSLVLSAIILVSSGGLQRISEGDGVSLALKSAGPILLAFGLKVLIWDYLMCLKSGVLVYAVRSRSRGNPGSAGRMKISIGFAMAITFLALFDLSLTTLFTADFVKFLESVQAQKLAQQLSESPLIPPSWKDFFDSINLIVKEVIEKSLFVLNGSLIFYGGAVVALITSEKRGFIDWQSIEEKPFTSVAFALALVSSVVLVVFYAISR